LVASTLAGITLTARQLSTIINSGKALYGAYGMANSAYKHMKTNKKNKMSTYSKKPAMIQAKKNEAIIKKVMKKRKPSYTTGYHGKPLGPFKKAKQRDFYNEVGSTIQMEKGGKQTDTNCVYLGVSTPINEAFISISRAIIKNLFTQMGHKILSWNSLVPVATGATTIQYRYYLGTNATTSTNGTGYTVSPAVSYNDLAIGWYGQLVADWTVNKSHNISEIYVQNAVGADSTRVATLWADDCILYQKHNASIKIQNVTLGTHDNVYDANDQLANDITNNPLVGKLYEGTNISGFIPKFRQTGALASWGNGFVADINTGLIVKNSDDVGTNDEFDKPPPASQFKNCKLVKNVSIKPGEIQRHSVTFTSKTPLNTFLNRHIDKVIVNTNQDIVYTFNSFMFGLEKSLDSRQGESAIAVAFETTHTIRSAIVVKKNTYSTQIVKY
jgi:hypothetical protein